MTSPPIGQAIQQEELLAIENTGERMVPELSDLYTFWEHVHRYAFASRFVKGKRVLDIACGEGYGAAALQSAGATRVMGVDISEISCNHAARKYGLETSVGSAEDIPVTDGSIDVVVSFETIEHIPNPLRFISECARVLRPAGRLIVSTPNKEVYSEPGQALNPHHCSEMTEAQFVSALQTKFDRVKLYSQHPRRAPWWSPRTLAADVTPWSQRPLFRRLQRSAQFRTAPIMVYALSMEQRTNVIEEILQCSRRPSSLVNPYEVRRRRRWLAEDPVYFIASAQRSGR